MNMPIAPISLISFRDILMKHLAPMFPGATITETLIRNDACRIVIRESANEVLIKPDPRGNYGLRLIRLHPFDSVDLDIVEKFTNAISEKVVAIDHPFFDYLVEKCPQDVVASSMQPKLADDYLVPSIIDLLRKWASETYEGNRISVAIGIDPYAEGGSVSNVHLSQFSGRDFAKVLSNGVDTLLVLSLSGHIIEHVALPPNNFGTGAFSSIYVPHRHQPLAEWCKKTRVAFSLNRQGEILVLKDQRLRFAFRRGVWSHFDHSAMIARLEQTPAVSRAVYATCLDISFARKGGCIAVVDDNKRKLVKTLVSQADLLAKPINEKTQFIQHIIGRTFPQIARPIREELTAIDGAVVIGHDGEIFAVGAIVTVPSGSDGGGRKAAAKALSRLGLAIKISADGGITAYKRRGPGKPPETVFEICI